MCISIFRRDCIYVYVCMYGVRICMYVSIHNFMSVCERCMLNNGCVETLHIWHICNSKNMCILKFVFCIAILLI